MDTISTFLLRREGCPCDGCENPGCRHGGCQGRKPNPDSGQKEPILAVKPAPSESFGQAVMSR